MNKIDISNNYIKVCLDIFAYRENRVQMMYSPALDLCGYGYTADEAKKSFETTVTEYLRYALENNTLHEDLNAHGWVKTTKEKEFMSPDIIKLMRSNKQLQSVMRNNYRKVSRRISVPVAN